MGKLKNLTGQRFGKLTVIERADDRIATSGRSLVRWKCLCEYNEIDKIFDKYLSSKADENNV